MKRLRVTVDSTGVVVGDSIAVAETFLSRLRGLMFRRALAEGEGLLLTHVDAIHMGFMRFRIDAVFLDPEGRVTNVAERLRPWIGIASAVRSGATADRLQARDVLELPAGRAAACGIAAGVVLRCEAVEPAGRVEEGAAGNRS